MEITVGDLQKAFAKLPAYIKVRVSVGNPKNGNLGDYPVVDGQVDNADYDPPVYYLLALKED